MIENSAPPLRVLLVDDSTLVRDRLAQLVAEITGALVCCEAADAPSGTAEILARRPDVAIIDLSLPGGSGFDVLAAVKQAAPEVVVIVLTLHSGKLVGQRCRELGADFFFEKDGAYEGIADALEHLAASRAFLRSARETLRLHCLALATIANAIVVTDPAGIIVWVNRAFTQLTGYAPEEAIGQSTRLLRSGRHDEAFYRQFWQTLISGRTWVGEFVNRRKDGTHYRDEHTVTPVHATDGTLTHFVSVMRDITQTRRLEAAVRDHAALLDQASDAIVVSDLDGYITYWNQGAQRIFGWKPAEAIGQQVDRFLNPASLAKVAAARELILSGASWRGEIQAEDTLRGRTVILDTRLSLVRDDEGCPKARLSISTDITQAKTLELQFLRAQRFESLGMLSAGLAHDLNNILAPLALGLPVLRESLSSDAHIRLVDDIEASVKRAAKLVGNVLDFSRGSTNEHVRVNPGHLLGEIAGLLRATLPKNIRVESIVADPLPAIRGNATELHQVLLNLGVNARDAMPHGGLVRLDVSACVIGATDAFPLPPDAEPGAYVRFTVEDSGSGIPPAVLTRLWEPFFSTKGRGNGFGLSTVKTIVKAHAGFVSVASAPGRGTAFEVFLPVAAAAETSDRFH